jgi:hypothetical protein
MTSRGIWLVSALFGYAAVLIVLFGVPWLRESDALWRLAHGVLYGAFAAVLLGALARGAPNAGPATWRSVTLALAAIAAGAGVWLTQRLQSAAFDAWMAALLGIAVAVMLPRWLPDSITRYWLAIERRAPREP